MIAHAALGAASGIVMAAIICAAMTRLPFARDLRREAAGQWRARSASWILAASLLVAGAEELAFRGWTLTHFGIGPSCAIFGALHVGPRARHLGWAAIATLVGLAFAGLTIATGDLAAAIAAHATANFLVLLFVARS